ncbi:MAG: D-arabinose 1-dehydrogenase-like Zn-dependent alcohol dehydrogenase [Granulosicoccus sp.]|jgi:D-arabinose 1-dehydrogenase-like Zn-dependent alcohol dehydrogenase
MILSAAFYTGNKYFSGKVRIGVANCGICGTELHVCKVEARA